MSYKKTVTDTRIEFEYENGEVLASVDYVLKDGVYFLEHTNVDASLRGQGVAGKLMEAFDEFVREKGAKATPVCSYAVAWYDKNSDKKDVLA